MVKLVSSYFFAVEWFKTIDDFKGDLTDCPGLPYRHRQQE